MFCINHSDGQVAGFDRTCNYNNAVQVLSYTDGGYFLTCQSSFGAYLTKLDSDGFILWEREFKDFSFSLTSPILLFEDTFFVLLNKEFVEYPEMKFIKLTAVNQIDLS